MRLLPRPRVPRVLYWLVPALLYAWGWCQAPHVSGPDLVPRPDAVEYALLAQRLAHFQAPLVAIGPHDYPSRYALSFPLLLTPFVWIFNGDLTRLYLASGLFGLIATILIAGVGARLLGSRAAGMMAAAFWALHTQTVWAASLNMSDTAIVMMFFVMLGLALPWIEIADDAALSSSRSRAGMLRAALLGFVLAWLTLAKAPFAWWSLSCAVLLAARARREKRWGPLAALVIVGGICALADALYRRWLLGQWGMNGYQYWFPEVYDSLTRIFNLQYLLHPWDPSYELPAAAPGNFVFYGRMVAGISNDFYSPYMAIASLVALVCLLWPGRRGRPSPRFTLLMAGWGIVGVLFCGLYFFQSERFALFWIPVVDLLVAWGLAQVWTWVRLRRGRLRPWHAARWAQGIGLLVLVLLVRGEIRRVAGIPGNSPQHRLPTVSGRMREMLRAVPEGAWLFSNYELPLTDYYRPSPGPTGVLHMHYTVDRWYNGMVYDIMNRPLTPRRERAQWSPWLAGAPESWRSGQPLLIDRNDAWDIDDAATQRIFAQGAWIIVYTPREYWIAETYIDQTIIPKLAERLKLERVATRDEMTLYHATLNPHQSE